jgi:hypothetical protein
MSPEPCLRFVPSVFHPGKRVRAFGKQVFFRHPEETFHEFLAAFMRETLGREWWDAQNELCPAKQHAVRKWYEAVGAWRKKHQTDEFKISDGQWCVPASGYAQSIVQCAYDFLVLHHKGYLSNDLLDRFRNARQFQGVRYEIAVAAIFVRTGFSLRFLEAVHGQKICEFVATHTSGIQVAVEAKSRHRSGVLNEKGARLEDVVPDLKKRYSEARKKKPEMPFVIFLDINLPPCPEIPWEEQPWLTDIKKMLEYFPEPMANNPDVHNGLIFTNFAFYYDGDSAMKHHPPLYFWSLFPKYPVPDPGLWNAIMETIQNYTRIPREV